MDLTSIPDEMLRNVLKYTDYVTTTKTRKLYTRADNIAKSFEIGTRMPVKNMSLGVLQSRNEDGLIVWRCYLDIEPSILSFIKYKTRAKNPLWVNLQYKTKNTAYFSILNMILSKIKIIDHFKVHDFFTMNDQMLECLAINRQCFRNLATLVISSTMIDCSATALQTFLACTKRLQSIDFQTTCGDIDIFFKSGAFTNRTWKKLHLCGYSFPRERLNDEFLLNVVKNCKRFSFQFKTSYTIEGVIRLIEFCLEEKPRMQSITLGEVQCNKALFETVVERIKSVDRNNLICKIQMYNDLRTADVKCWINFTSNPCLIIFSLHDDINPNQRPIME